MATSSSVIGILRVLLTANTAEYESAMKKAADSAKVWSKDFKQIGQQASDVGKELTKALTVPLAGLGLASAKLAMDFESSFAGVRKTVNATEPEFQAMAQAFRGLSKEIPINVNELNRLGEAAGALGIPKEEVVEFAKVMAQLGVTTNLTSDQAAESIAKIQNIFAAAGKETDRFAATLVALGNDGASTESQILSMAERIAGAGNAVGMAQGEVLAFASALSSVGIDAEMGGSAISRVFIDIAAAVSEGGEAVQGFADVAGVSIEQFSKLFKDDAAAAVNQFINGLGKVKASGGDLLATLDELGFKEIRVRDTLLRTAQAGDLLTRALNLQKVAWYENSALTEEARKRFETTRSQLTLLWNRVQDLGITLGNALLPVVKQLIGFLDNLLPVLELLLGIFVKLPPQVQMAAFSFAAIAAAIGPVLIIAGQLSISVSALTTAFTANGIAMKAIGPASTVAATGLTALRGAMAALLTPLGLVGAAAVAATAAITNLIEARAKQRMDAETDLAKLDAINLAIQRGAAFTISYAEAIKYNAEWNRKRIDGLKAAADETKRTTTATQSLTDKLDEQNAKVKAADREIAQLSATAKSKLVEAIKSGAFSIKDLSEATGLSEMALKRFEDSLKDSAKAAKQAEKDYDAATRAGIKLYKEHHAAAKAIQDMIRQIATEREIAPLTQTIEEATAAIKLFRGVIEMPVKTGHEAVADFWEQLRDMGTQAVSVGQQIKTGLIDVLGELPDVLRQAFMGGGGLLGGLKAFGVQLADTVMAPLMEKIKSLSNSKWVQGAIGAGSAGATALGGAMGGNAGATVAGVASGIGGAALGATGAFAGVGGAIALGAATMGIGAAAVGVALAVKKITGNAGRDAVKAFAESMGGFDALQARMRAVGSEGDAMWVKLTQGSGRNDKKQAQQNIAEIAKRLEELEQVQARFNTGLTTALGGIIQWGGKIPDALKPYLDQLREAGRLTQENIGLLDMLAGEGEVDWQRMQSTAEKYGIEVSTLGQTFQNQRLHAGWQELIDDADLLVRGGADVTAMLSGMADEISSLVNDSKRFGTEIPENMRPWIQKLIDSRELLDENGQAITDMDGMTFGDTLQTSLENLVDEVRRLIETLGGVPAALDRIPRQLTIDVDYNVGTAPSWPELEPPASFARGSNGWRNFGDGTLAVLHGTEAVVRPGDMLPGLREPAQVPINSGPVQAITILEVDKRELGRAVADALPGELRRLGIRVRV